MLDIPVTPIAGAAVSPASPETPPTDSTSPNLKPVGEDTDFDKLYSNPIVKPLLSGALPAIRFSLDDKSESVMEVRDNASAVLAAGLSAYKAQNKEIVLFNPEKVDSAALKVADSEGKLSSVVPPASELLSGGASEAAPATSGEVASPPPTVTGRPAPARTQNKIAQARLNNLMPGTPTERAIPAGGVLNQLLARPI